MIFPLLVLSALPYAVAFLWTLLSSQPTLYDQLAQFGFVLLVFSPIWTIFVGWMFFWMGKSIEAIETAKTVVATVKDNKHHAVNAFNFIKKKVNRG